MDQLILVVDDNVDNLKLTEILLELEGYAVKTAQDSQEALSILQTCRPTLILMDIQLPGMDGLELTRRLRQEPEWRDVTIVALTAYAMKCDEENARAAGCDGYIAKPIDTRTFPTIVRGFVNGSTAGSSLNDAPSHKSFLSQSSSRHAGTREIGGR